MKSRSFLHGVMAMIESLNTEFLEELKDIMEEEFPLLLETYLRESELQYQRIDDAWRGRALDELRRSAHSLKGSSGNIGAEQLAELCSTLERQAKQAEVEVLPATLHALLGEFQVVKASVSRLYECHR